MRLFPRKRAATAPAPALPPPDDLLPLPDCGRVPVLGSGAHQAELTAAAHGRAAGADLDRHLPATAALVPDPASRHGVRVDVLVDGAVRTVGALPREIGLEYRPALARVGDRGQLGTCPARITGGGGNPYGVYLLLAPPREIEVFTGARDPVVAEGSNLRVLLWNERTCGVTREDEHQDALVDYAPFPGQQTREVIACLGFCRIDSGRYRGEEAIEVQLGGRRVGQLTYAMSLRYAQSLRRLLATGVEVTCSALTRSTRDGIRVDLLLPQLTDSTVDAVGVDPAATRR
ncbi:hypothetical protein [Actinokineospora bangkokensis]|uniref:Uncharacterized protein n=1 Tax=Actinokineospora bangkokensis TaxID=1193682 RepID=A0A1Q9LEQ7_9PSEU|nr:hypothetical protein [Actinokineospora bangkokensis]OLR90500.1 hypothetical protein BJP25_28105 [Actinokineospora bangkokensis]